MNQLPITFLIASLSGKLIVLTPAKTWGEGYGFLGNGVTDGTLMGDGLGDGGCRFFTGMGYVMGVDAPYGICQ